MGGVSGREILTGVFRYAKSQRHWDIRLVEMSDGLRPDALRRAESDGIDGIIACSLSDPVLKRFVNDSPAPLALIGSPHRFRRISGGAISFIDCGNESIGSIAAHHFLSLGQFNGFGYVHINPGDDIDLREKSFRRTILAAGKVCSTFTAETEKTNNRIDPALLADWIRSLPKPAAVMAFCDSIAVQILKVCHGCRIPVPGQVSVIGVDNDAILCDFTVPPLSSVQPDHEHTGFMAAKELNALISDKASRPARTLTCPPLRIVERDSTHPLTPAGHLIRKAYEFIRSHASRRIGVPDVVAHLKVSRRLADLRFREVESCSIRQAIESCRMEMAEKALRETMRDIGRIALDCGYRSAKTFNVAFRKRHGITPSRFRENHTTGA